MKGNRTQSPTRNNNPRQQIMVCIPKPWQDLTMTIMIMHNHGKAARLLDNPAKFFPSVLTDFLMRNPQLTTGCQVSFSSLDVQSLFANKSWW